MNKLSTYIAFIAGAAIGSVATWQITKKVYERIAQEEIDSVKEAFSRKDDVVVEDDCEVENDDEEDSDEEDEDLDEAVEIIKISKYSEDAKNEPREPYVVSPEAFGELDDYEIRTLTYYADDVLTDDDDRLINDIRGTVGYEALSELGCSDEYGHPVDTVYVRNEQYKIDYEILFDQRDYAEVIARSPYKAEV